MKATQKDTSTAKQLFVEFLQDHLGIEFRGFQSAFGHGSDLILFRGPLGSTLAVPASVMHEPREKAQEIIREKIAASEASFGIDVETAEAARRYWQEVSRSVRAVNQTSIGKAIIGRCAASAGH